MIRKVIFVVFVVLLFVFGCKPEKVKVSEYIKKKHKKPSVGKVSGQESLGSNENEDRIIVAEFKGGKLTLKQVREYLTGLPYYDRLMFQEKDKLIDYVKKLVEFEILFLEAKKLGYDKHPEILRVLKREMVKKFLDEESKKQISLKGIDEKELKDFYNKHLKMFTTMEKRKVYLISVKKKDVIDKVYSTLSKISDKKKVFDEFRKLSRIFSDNKDLRDLDGLLGWLLPNGELTETITRRNICKKLIKSIFSYKIQKVSTPVHCDGEYYLFYVDEVVHPKIQEFSKVKLKIKNLLIQTKIERIKRNIINSLVKKADIKIYDENLKELQKKSGLKGKKQIDKNRFLKYANPMKTLKIPVQNYKKHLPGLVPMKKSEILKELKKNKKDKKKRGNDK